MSSKKIQLIFILGVCAITLHFSLRLGKECFHYLSMSSEAKARVNQWETVQIKDLVGLKAFYEFEHQNKFFEGEFLFPPPYFANESAALWDIKERAKSPCFASFDPEKPHVSCLEKQFPTWLLIRAIICYGVVIYFFRLYKKLSLV